MGSLRSLRKVERLVARGGISLNEPRNQLLQRAPDQDERPALCDAIDDAYLAALAVSRGATLASFDEDFEPFVRHGLRWERPEA